MLDFLNAVRDDATNFLKIPGHESLNDKELQACSAVNGMVLQYIQNRSPSAKSAGLYQNPFAVMHLPNPTKAEQLIVAEQEPTAIKHIPRSVLYETTEIKAVSRFSNTIYCYEQPSDSVKVLAIIKSKAHEHFKSEVQHGLLAATYGFLTRNKMNLSRCLGANENFDSLEEMALLTHQIRNTLVETYPLLNEVLM